MDIILELILKPILYILGSVLSGIAIFAVNAYLIPYLKQRLGDDKYNMLVTYIKMCMSAAEEKFPNLDGEQKAEWVIDRIIEIFQSSLQESVYLFIRCNLAIPQDPRYDGAD